MGRGKDKTIDGKDIASMSPEERAGLGNLARMGQVKVKATATVRRQGDGNVVYEDPSRKGTYNEDNL